MFQRRQSTGAVLFAVLLLSVTGCTSLPPPKVAWENDQPAVGPKRPEPQGILVVYSESGEGMKNSPLSIGAWSSCTIARVNSLAHLTITL